MSSFDPIKNHADFIRNNGIDAFGTMSEYVKHQSKVWDMLKASALKNDSDKNEEGTENENTNI